MIERMLKTTVICRKEDQISTLKDLRRLGIMHVEQIQKPSSTEISVVQQGLEKVNQALFVLSESSCPSSEEGKHIFKTTNAKILTDKLINTVEEIKSFQKEIETITREREKLLPWGCFSFTTIDQLSDKGIYVYLCCANKKEVDLLKAKGVVEIISEVKGRAYFILISKEKYKKEELPLAEMPSMKLSLSELNEKVDILNEKIIERKKIISNLTDSIDKIREYKAKLEDTLEFFINKESLDKEKNLAYITGFIPKRKEHLIIATAKKGGWGVILEKPKDDDLVPTHLAVPRIIKISRPIFDFLGISPGYKENDISWCFLLFLGIFFAMLLGDAGYGALFLLIAIVLKITLRKNKDAQLPLNLFIYFSILTILWGTLSGQYFSIETKYFPREMRGWHFLTDPVMKNINLQLLCFLLAAIHLSIARIWRAINSYRSIRALGQLGWAMVIWGNFFTAIKLILVPEMTYPVFAYWLYIIGISFILLFYVHWKKPESIFETPLSMIGSFVDVLSYIRLFAVGIAAVYIAENFNNMGKQLIDISPKLAICAFIVVGAGHILNIALGLMGVLIHGVRLNTLEFSNHMELKWGGVKYNPFRKRIYDIKNNK